MFDVFVELVVLIGCDDDCCIEIIVVCMVIGLFDDVVVDLYDVYLWFYFLLYCLVVFYGLNVGGLFGVLINVVWINYGFCVIDGFEVVWVWLCCCGLVIVYGVDKFFWMVDYVVFIGVCIVDVDCVWLGVYLVLGIIVMYEGFVNYNVGILGVLMVEGCILVGVVVGDGFDVGGGVLIMGMLFGGGIYVILIGKCCLFGVNFGLGILLGDDCVVEVGLYVIVGMRVIMFDSNLVKVCEFFGSSNLLFCCNFVSGVVEVLVCDG